MRIAITGASGHIGNVLCRYVLQEGHHVRAMYHTDNRALVGLDLDRVQGNVLEKGDLLRLFEGCEVVVNCAAMISIDGDPTGEVFHTNTQGPMNVWEAAVESGLRRLVHVSSVHAVEELPHSQPYDERRSYKSIGDPWYDYSKARGEEILFSAAKSYKMELVVVRPSCVIGPFDMKPSLMGAALIDLYRGRMPVLPPGGYDLVDVSDVVRSISEAITKGRNGEVYVISGKYYSMLDMAASISNISGRKAPRYVIPYGLLKGLLPLVSLWARLTRTTPKYTLESINALMNGHPDMDHSKAQLELGHVPRPLDATLRDFYSWQKEQGVIQ